jgi:hypothetical protein
MSNEYNINNFNLIPIASKATAKGDIFGRLVVFNVGKDKSTHKTFAVCQCTCGSEPKRVRIDHLRSGKTDSCGCVYDESVVVQYSKMNGHGRRYSLMMSRCYKITDAAYPGYGGRGIKVCDRWHDCLNYASDISDGYFIGAQLDRIDNDGDYSPENTRWVTCKVNNNNRRDTIHLTFNGITDTISGWSERTGIDRQYIWQRINVYKWSVERALTEKTGENSKLKAMSAATEVKRKAKAAAKKAKLTKHELNGELYSLRELSDLSGVNINLLRKRINERKWSVERAIKNENFKGNNQNTDNS